MEDKVTNYQYEYDEMHAYTCEVQVHWPVPEVSNEKEITYTNYVFRTVKKKMDLSLRSSL
jgi:hypothetical protein